ncbi:MAG: hypothetical protein KIT84_08065 [Labilithrix sp.]|nr:hypothetical protein [Labilithrix sp.]MCW5810953.1 hypothetical protein [Labilithrix sp.]
MQARRSLPSRRSSSRSTSSRFASSLAIAVALTLVPSAAHAIEGQHHLGLAPALGILVISDKSTTSTGAGGALHYTYGLTDQFNLALEASSVVVAANQKELPTSPHTRPTMVHQAAAGVSYVIDIFRWVPYLQLQGGAAMLTGGTLDRALVLPTVSAGLGVDYQISRSMAVGVAGREHLFVSKLDTYPSYTTVLLRFELMWGY